MAAAREGRRGEAESWRYPPARAPCPLIWRGELAVARGMTDRKRRPPKRRSAPAKSPYFLQPGKQGAFIVLRRPAGNRIDPKLCGTMATRALALALVKQLERAESVVHDLFLEATDDGIEALEAVLEACRQSVMQRGDARGGARTVAGGSTAPRRRGRGKRRGSPRARGAPGGGPAEELRDPAAEDPDAA